MISICTEVEINAEPTVVWEILVQTEIPNPENQPPTPSASPVLRKGEVVKREEGKVLAIEARSSSGGSYTIIEYTLQPQGRERTLVQMSLQIESTAGWIESLIYRLAKRFIHKETKGITAELKRNVEYRAFKGQPLDPSTLMVSAVQIIDCKTLITEDSHGNYHPY
jgi:hypothetical protein